MDESTGSGLELDSDFLLSAITDRSDEAIFAVDLNGVIVFANAAMAQMAGVPPHGALGRRLEDVFPTVRVQDMKQSIAMAAQTGDCVLAKETVIEDDGGASVISARYSPVRDRGGQIIAVAAILRDITEQHSQQANAARYYQMAEITQEAWWEEDLLTGQSSSSRRLCEILGWDEAMLECPISVYWEFIHPDDKEQVRAEFDRAVRDGADFKISYRIRHADGHFIWVEDQGRIVARDAEGRPARMMGVMIDVTARKGAEIALQESEQRYRMVADITREAWSEENLETGQSKSSRRFCEMLGFGDEMLDCPLDVYRSLIHPEDRVRAIAEFEEAVRCGSEFMAVYRLRHASGHYIWVEDRGRVIERDAQGRPLRILGAITDITARKEAEIALQESERNFRHLFDDAPDAYLITDAKDGRILACNRAAERMLRGSSEQIVGITPDRISPPLQPDGAFSSETIRAKIRTAVEKGYHRFEWVHRRFDGSDCWVEVTLTVGMFQHQTVIYAIWREIGEIIAAKQAAEAASIAKSQFLSVMSHELRTPLTAIMGMFQLIEIAGVGERAREFVVRGLKSSEHLLRLVEDILDFSSIEAGRLALSKNPFRLGTLLDEVSDASAGKRKDNVRFAIDAESSLLDLELSGDALRLKQVLINLVGNAFKFTDYGHVMLSVTRAGGTADEPLLEYAVNDTGIGMTTSQTDQLFQAFSQVDMSDTRRFGGTGLGLVISQRLVGLLGGEPIRVESRPGLGSRFAFRLALPVARRAPGTGASQPPARPRGSEARLAGLRVLLVEDSETIRLALRLLLEQEQAIVDEAADGAEGVSKALAAAIPHDAVLMDMQLPVQNGIEATRELRSRGYSQPIIALTANAFTRDRDACLAAGMNGYIAKPVKIDDLVAAVRRTH